MLLTDRLADYAAAAELEAVAIQLGAVLLVVSAIPSAEEMGDRHFRR